MDSRLATALVFALIAGCAEPGAEDLQPEGVPAPAVPGKSDAFCPTVAAFVGVTEPPQYSCAPLDVASAAETADINRFWTSQVAYCSCGPDYPSGQCEGATAMTGGWVYASLPFIADLRTSGSDLPSAYVYAHEMGHELQGAFNIIPPIEQVKELQADCLAGYYIGSLVCKGAATKADVLATLATACVLADGTGDLAADLNTHGTCEQRAGWVAAGIDGYFAGKAAFSVCAP